MLFGAQGREKLERTRDGKIAAFLWKTLWARHKGTLMASLALQGVYSAFNFAGPVILNKIVTFLQNWSLWKAEQNAPLVRLPPVIVPTRTDAKLPLYRQIIVRVRPCRIRSARTVLPTITTMSASQSCRMVAAAACRLRENVLTRCPVLTQPAGVSAVSKPSIGTAYLYSVLIFVFPLIGAIALVHSNRVAIQVQIRLRAQLTSAVYLKALRLSSRCPRNAVALLPIRCCSGRQCCRQVQGWLSTVCSSCRYTLLRHCVALSVLYSSLLRDCLAQLTLCAVQGPSADGDRAGGQPHVE